MAYFSVVLHGEGISVPSDESGAELVGFYAARWVRASSAEEARKAASALVMTDWTNGEYAELNCGDPPRITVDTITKVSLLRFIWRQPGAGHAFYSSA